MDLWCAALVTSVINFIVKIYSEKCLSIKNIDENLTDKRGKEFWCAYLALEDHFPTPSLKTIRKQRFFKNLTMETISDEDFHKEEKQVWEPTDYQNENKEVNREDSNDDFLNRKEEYFLLI